MLAIGGAWLLFASYPGKEHAPGRLPGESCCAIGEQGPIGNQGDVGEQGPVGLQGPIGNQGSVGEQGIIGNKGLIGDQGLLGEQGSIGEQGNKGETGSIGPVGNQGPIGDKGKAGDDTILSNLFYLNTNVINFSTFCQNNNIDQSWIPSNDNLSSKFYIYPGYGLNKLSICQRFTNNCPNNIVGIKTLSPSGINSDYISLSDYGIELPLVSIPYNCNITGLSWSLHNNLNNIPKFNIKIEIYAFCGIHKIDSYNAIGPNLIFSQNNVRSDNAFKAEVLLLFGSNPDNYKLCGFIDFNTSNTYKLLVKNGETNINGELTDENGNQSNELISIISDNVSPNNSIALSITGIKLNDNSDINTNSIFLNLGIKLENLERINIINQ